MHLFYKDLTINDLPTWEKLAKSEFLPGDFCDAKYLSKQWNKTKGWVLLNKENEWIGCCFIDFKNYKFNHGGVHFLESCTFPKFRKQGYSKYLNKIRFDNSIGYQKSMCINPNNIPSIAAATKCGFQKTIPHKTWDIYICNSDHYPKEFDKLELKHIATK